MRETRDVFLVSEVPGVRILFQPSYANVKMLYRINSERIVRLDSMQPEFLALAFLPNSDSFKSDFAMSASQVPRR